MWSRALVLDFSVLRVFRKARLKKSIKVGVLVVMGERIAIGQNLAPPKPSLALRSLGLLKSRSKHQNSINFQINILLKQVFIVSDAVAIISAGWRRYQFLPEYQSACKTYISIGTISSLYLWPCCMVTKF